jgi:hypothetical protein
MIVINAQELDLTSTECVCYFKLLLSTKDDHFLERCSKINSIIDKRCALCKVRTKMLHTT